MIMERSITKTMRTFFMIMILFFAFAPLAFANNPAGGGTYSVVPNENLTELGKLGTILNKIVGFFTSMYMKAILMIALGGLGVGMIMNRGEPGMVKKFIPWVAGCTLLLSLSQVTETIFGK